MVKSFKFFKPFDLNYHQFFLYVPLFFSCGIGAFFLFDFNVPINLNSIYIFTAIISVFLLFAFFFKNSIASFFFLSVAIVLIGYNTVLFHLYDKPAPLYRTFYSLLVQGDVVDVETFPSAKRILLDNLQVVDKNWPNFPKKVRIKLNGYNHNINVGDRVELKATLMPPPVPAYPNAFDFSIFAWFNSISAVGFNTSQLLILSNNQNNNSYSFLDKYFIFMQNIRADIIAKIQKSLNKNQASIAVSLVVGEQSAVDKNILQNYRDSGLAHILSVSGMHMSLLAILVFAAFRFVLSLFPSVTLYYNVRKISAVLALIVTFFYLSISGGAIPAVRAFIMVFVAFSAILINRRALSLRSVAIAAIIILIIAPQSITNAGFQMSFSAVVALISLYTFFFIKKGKTISSFLLIYLYGIIITSVIATLATAPFAIYHFNRFSSYSVLANLLASSLFAILIMPALLIAVIAMPFNLEFYPLKLAGIGIQFLNDIALWVADLPHSVILFPQIPTFAIISLAVGAYLFCIVKTSLSRRLFFLIFFVPFFYYLIAYQKPDFIINHNSSLVGVNLDDKILLSPGAASRFQRNVWLNVNAQQYNQNDKMLATNFFNSICRDDDFCSFSKNNYTFLFSFNKNVHNKILKIYHNNTLYRSFDENDLKLYKTMLFYIQNDKLIINTVKNNKTIWWN